MQTGRFSYALVMLLLLNFGALVWHTLSPNIVIQTSDSYKENLLPELDKATLAEILQTFITAYNSEDPRLMWEVGHPLARLQASQEQITDAYAATLKIVSSIHEGQFSHSEFLHKKGNRQFFELEYLIRISTPDEESRTGGCILTVGVERDEWGIFGWRVGWK